MNNKHLAVLLKGKGGLDQLELTEVPTPDPQPGQVLVKVLVCGVGFTDVVMRTGFYPFAPKYPFVPGYEIVGIVVKVGSGVTHLKEGDRVAALTVHGGYAEYLLRESEHFVKVPTGLDDKLVVALILNYVTAYQMIHREAALKSGQSALVTGAAGGVGTALLELLSLASVTTYAGASTHKHEFVRSFGAIPFDGRNKDFDRVVRSLAPSGVDAAFDGLGGWITSRCINALKRGGHLVSYGMTASVKPNGKSDLGALLHGTISCYMSAPLWGRRSTFYGITAIYRKNRQPFLDDLPVLFDLLSSGKIHPKIESVIKLEQVMEAQARLERGEVQGKIVVQIG